MKIAATGIRRKQYIHATLAFILAILAFIAPFTAVRVPERVGALLIWAAILIFIQGVHRATDRDRRSARFSGFITLLIGVLLVNAPLLVGTAMVLFVKALFVFDAIRQSLAFWWRRKNGEPYLNELLSAIGNLAVVGAIFLLEGKELHWVVAIAGGLRIAGMAFEILSARIGEVTNVSEDVVRVLQLPDQPEVQAIAKRVEQEEATRAPIDRAWILSFIFILFFIHLGRMGFDRSASGILSPFVALVGDIVMALIITFFILFPIWGLVRSSSRPIERRLWKWVLTVSPEKRSKIGLSRLAQLWLEYRIRVSIRIRKSGYSIPTALRVGLQMGLPFSALLVAIIPVFGMSWYFDTENWAAGIWDGWAAGRTDIWRKAMTESITPQPTGQSFMLHPDGVSNSRDFSFVIVGDPGEGDASQLILHDQIVRVSENPEVKFVVISSDVVYPDGAMKDYEKNFWLPMKGVTKPVYAIPGNHDWYDALDGFAATFYEPEAARTAMRARREADLNLTITTEKKMDALIAEAARLRSEYRVPTGYQQAPFFQIQTDRFAFITIETGVLRRIDDAEMTWLKQALEAAKGKFIFVLLGHPFYAIGEYQGDMNPDFAALHELLRQYGATIAMAGDTHDLEYYQEPLSNTPGRVMHHFVNGGGGAYLSIGAALRPHNEMPEKVWAHYPARAPLTQKIEQNNGWLKRPAWIWTKKYNGWPFSAEWLSAAFDYNVAPFFQSFIEVKVSPSQNQVRLIAHGVHGPLTWGDMEASEGVKPSGADANAPVEWVFPLR